MRRSAPLTFRWLVAGIVAVLMLLGGALRPSPIDGLRVRAALEHVERTNDGGDRAHLERSSELSRVRVARLSDGTDRGGHDPSLGAFVVAFQPRHLDVERADVPRAKDAIVVRRVRPHVEHMVFLI